MKQELKFFLYIATIIGFIIFVGIYYFSDQNKKNSYRATILYDNNITKYNDNLIILKSDTENIIHYVENDINQNKKTYNFWKLLIDDEK